MAKEKKELKITPVGTTKFCHINKPDAYVDEDGVSGEPKYKVTLEIDPAEHPEFLDMLEDELKKSKGKNPVFYESEETGLAEIKFQSKFRPKAFDADGSPINLDETNVGHGSTMQVSFTMNPYKGLGGGVALYMQAVKVIEAVDFGGRGAEDYGF